MGLYPLSGQFSPGAMSAAHADLEGLDNCTKCHEIGNRVSDAKCLDCHKEIQSLLNQQRGYHWSEEVKSKTCFECHSEHHGRNFDALRFDEEAFDHKLTGYLLEGAHEPIDCKDCHKPDYISDQVLAARTKTFMGLQAECLGCHQDYHQETLDENCIECHGFDSFVPTIGFDHSNSDFPLIGAHEFVNCLACHPKEIRNSREFQKFSNVAFQACTDCHEDTHQGRFGANCTDCHGQNSWSQLKNTHRFDHSLTDYPLEGLHRAVACNDCHLGGDFKKDISFSRCTDCHEDYHQNEIEGILLGTQDCNDCHSLLAPFTYSSYDWEDHQESDFELEGAHLASPCFACHKSDTERWDFKFDSHNCVSCHEDIHEDQISASYYPAQDCKACHDAEQWPSINFDHAETEWPLEGAHAAEDCRACHMTYENKELKEQIFAELKGECQECHTNVHQEQFAIEGQTNCTACHIISDSWNADGFDHQQTNFPLEGKHATVNCSACHKQAIGSEGKEFVLYKIEKFECIDCHGS